MMQLLHLFIVLGLVCVPCESKGDATVNLLRERVKASVLAQLCCDAACVGCHWQYNTEKIRDSFRNDHNPLVFPREERHLINPFYRMPQSGIGGNTFYGDQGKSLLRHLRKQIQSGVGFDVNVIEYAKELVSVFGNNTAMYGPFPEINLHYPYKYILRPLSIKLYLGEMYNRRKELPKDVEEGRIYLDISVADDQSDSYIKVPIIIGAAVLSRQDQLEEKWLTMLKNVVELTQNGPNAVPGAFLAARVLFHLYQQTPPPITNQATQHHQIIRTVFENVRSQLLNPTRPFPLPTDQASADAIGSVLANVHTPHMEFVARNGKGCAMLFGLINAMHAVLVYNRLEDAVKNTILAGGDSAGRANFIGACFCGLYGNCVPREWSEKYVLWDDVKRDLDVVFG